MSRSKLAAAGPYVERLAENDYVQDRLAEAVDNLHAAYKRASKRSAAKAAEDRRVWKRARRGVVAARDAAFAVRTGRKRKRRRGRVIVLGLLAAGGAAAAAGPLRDRLTDDQSPAGAPSAA